MPLDTSQVGSVGHLVGASLETAGHYLQSMLLDSLNSPVGGVFALGLFIISCFSSVYVYVTQKKPNLILGIALGPVIYFSVISIRSESYGAAWKFGLREYSRTAVANSTVEFSNGPDEMSKPPSALSGPRNPAYVSMFFSVYNRVISSVVQASISLIELISKKGDLTFVTKVERYDALFKARATDPDAKFIITGIIVPFCSNYYALTREYFTEGISVSQRSILTTALKNMGRAPVVSKFDHPEVFSWLDQRGVLNPYLLNRAPGVGEPPTESYGGDGINTLSCLQLWNAGIEILKRESALVISRVAASGLPEGLTAEEARKQLEDKYSSAIDTGSGTIVQLNYDQKLVLMINEVAVRMFLKELQDASPRIMTMHYGADIPIQEGGVANTQVQMPKTLRGIMKTDEYEEKGDFFSAMLALPYVQGALLYFLALTLPFFALASVIPGKQHVILQWMGFWLWAKLWDLGFAVVMMIDNILYILLPHGTPITDEIVASPWNAMKTVLEVDPTYSTYTYYHILAVCLAAVPVLTGFIVKEAGERIIGHVSGALTSFSGKVGFSMASFAQSAATRAAMGDVAQQQYQTVKASMGASRFHPVINAAMENASSAYAQSKILAANGQAGPAAASAAWANVHMGIAEAMIGKLGSAAEWNVGNSPYAMEMSSFGIRVLYSNHPAIKHFVPPGDAELAYMKAFHNTQIAGATDSFLGGGIQTVRGISNLLPPDQRAAITGDIIKLGAGYTSPESLGRQLSEAYGLVQPGEKVKNELPGNNNDPLIPKELPPLEEEKPAQPKGPGPLTGLTQPTAPAEPTGRGG